MKKLFIIISVFLAMVSFGGNILPAHAATLTPEQTAALQQSLDALKAKLATLEMQAEARAQTQTQTIAPAPAAPAAPVKSALSVQESASLSNALSLLATALTNLETEFAKNPQLAAGHEADIAVALQGISKTLSMIGVAMVTPASGTGIAQANVPASSGPTKVSVNVPSQAGAPTAVAQNKANNAADNGNAPVAPAPQTAQASSAFSLRNLNWPLVAVVVLILAAIALWLFWPGDDEEEVHAKKVSVVANKPSSSNQATVLTSSSARTVHGGQTPLQVNVERQAEKLDRTPQPQPQQQQRKPA